MSWRSVLRTWELVFQFGAGFFRRRSPWRSAKILKKARFECLETFWQLISIGIFYGWQWRWKITDLFDGWRLTPLRPSHTCTRLWPTSKQAASCFNQGRYQGRFPFWQIFRLEIPETFRVKWKVFAAIYRATFAIYSACTVRPSQRPWRLCLINSLAMFWKFFCCWSVIAKSFFLFLPARDKTFFVKILPAF